MEASGGRAETTTTRPTVLIAIEPRAYREVIGKAIGILRPELSVKAIEPGMLDAEILRTNPLLVLCDGSMETSVDGVPSRVMFRRNELHSPATVHLDGRSTEVENVNMEDLLTIVDRVVSSIRDEGTLDGDTHDGSRTSENMEQ